MQLPNWTDFVVVVAPLSRCGAIVVPIYRRDEVSYVLGDSEARAAITCDEINGFDHAAMFATLAAQHTGLDHVYVARSTRAGDGLEPLSSLVVDGDLDALLDELGRPAGPDDCHLIVYTSGTTSRPKGCVHTYNTLGFTVRTMAEGLRWRTDDVAFGPSPITHATGYMTSVLIPLFAGGATHLMEAWEPDSGLDRIRQHRCTTP